MPVSHVIYGLRVTANIALPGLSIVEDDVNAGDVQIRLRETPAFPPAHRLPSEFFYTSPTIGSRAQPMLRVGALNGGEFFGFFYSDGPQFVVGHRGHEVWADWPEYYSLEDACVYLLGPVMGFVLRLRGITCLHASAVAIENYAVALAGLTGAGKSSTAAAFARCGFSVLADDIVALMESEDRFLVQPAYPRVNLWPEAAGALFGYNDVLPRITPTWDKRYVSLGQNGYHFQATPLPLQAIYILSERSSGAVPVIERLAAGEALMTLVANTYANHLLHGDMRSQEFNALGRVASHIPVRRVLPVNDPAAIPDLCDTIIADALQLTTVKEPVPAAPSL